MRLQLHDGYTLTGRTEPVVTDKATGRVLFENLPVVNFGYRPALPDALASWRYAMARADSGKAEVDATAQFVCDHLAGWDVLGADGKEAPLTPDTVRRVPEPVLDQITRAIATWAPKEMGADAKN